MYISLLIRKWVSLPGPHELGMSESDAMGMRYFTPFQEGPTWEDWEERVKREYPVRYFLSDVLGSGIDRILTYFEHKWDKLLCHMLPSRRYHIVDLRKVDPLGHYRWGYLPPSYVMFLAAWYALRMFIERSKPEDPATLDYSSEERSSLWYINAKSTYDEAQILYHYWMVDRGLDQQLCTNMHRAMHAAANARDQERYQELKAQWMERYEFNENKEKEMFQRLAKIQPYLET